LDGSTTKNGGKLPDIAPELLLEAVATSCDISLVIQPDLTIEQIVAHGAIGAATANWRGRALMDLLAPESQRKLENRLTISDRAAKAPLMLELNHDAASGLDMPVRYTVARVGRQGALVMLGRDLRPMAEVQQRLVEAQLALQRDHEAQRELETRYRVLLEVGGAPILIVSTTTGRIVDVNRAAMELIGAARADLVDAPVAQEFEGRRRGEFLDSLSRMAGAEAPGAVELTVRRTRRRVQVTPTLFRAAGDKLLLCRIELTDTARAQIDELGEALAKLFQSGIDGLVFMDGEGTIKAANEAFLNLTDRPSQATVVGRSLGEFLSRGEVDLRVLLDNVKRVGRLRHYATRLNTDFGGQISVEMSATYIQDRGNAVIGLVIRDATSAEGLRWPGGVVGNEGLRNVTQLVGYSALKKIVAETTDIIEKMCIEAALELTGNNRAAASELLSLSRQSLYVKLRKFGLLSKAAAD
jgi:transcriptional regulator PpsR